MFFRLRILIRKILKKFDTNILFLKMRYGCRLKFWRNKTKLLITLLSYLWWSTRKRHLSNCWRQNWGTNVPEFWRNVNVLNAFFPWIIALIFATVTVYLYPWEKGIFQYVYVKIHLRLYLNFDVMFLKVAFFHY